jgi:hypothetical protein
MERVSDPTNGGGAVCCQETRTLNLPPAVIDALARYRRLLGERAWDWGDEQLPGFFRWARFSLLGPVFEAVAETGDWASAIRSVVGDDVPPGIVVVRVGEDGMLLRAELRLLSRRCARWSVTDSSDGAWFPDGVLPKWDVHHRPFFHGHDVRARARSVGAERLTLVGPDGIMAEGDAGSELRMEKRVEGPTWISAVARGAGHPNTLDESVLAHTSSVYVDVAGQRVACEGDVRWCLRGRRQMVPGFPRHARKVRGRARSLRPRDPRRTFR